MSSKDIGDQAESLAQTHLENAGLIVVEQNYRSRRGEIDLIMLDNKILVFVEVRFRKSARFGSALESIDHRKQSRIIHTAQYYLQQLTTDYSGYRFDVVAISSTMNTADIVWIKDAFQMT
ncbi:MAG: YraN family protein [Methylophagaceae bacterium]